MIPVVTQLVRPTAAELADVAGVFDQYRRHYGEPVTAGRALAWLTEHTGSGLLTVFAAHIGGDLAGIATTVPCRRRCGWAAPGSSAIYTSCPRPGAAVPGALW